VIGSVRTITLAEAEACASVMGPAPGYLVNEQLHEGSDKRANRSNVASSLEAYMKSRPLFTDNEKTLQGRIPNPNVSGGAKPR